MISMAPLIPVSLLCVPAVVMARDLNVHSDIRLNGENIISDIRLNGENVNSDVHLYEETTIKTMGKNKKSKKESQHLRRERTLQVAVNMEMIRFSKLWFEEDYKNDEHLPLTALDFPLSDNKRDIIRDSNGVSIVTNSDIIPRYEGSILDINDVLPAFGLINGPTYPADGEVYWNDLEYVVEAQLQRQNCGETQMAKDVWNVPKTWEDFNLIHAAEAVHDEYPGYWQAKHLEGMFGAFGTEFEVDNDIISKRSKVEFLQGAVMLAEVNTWAVGCVATYNFIAKWMYGRPRPEEVAWMIKTGEIGVDDGVPRQLVSKVMALTNFNKREDFTEYPEGSPRHPSWPAMHSAASNLSMWMSVLFNLTPEQMEEVKKVDFAVSFARTVAGVHYMSDNVDGLNLGQEILAKELPYYLEAVFGSDPDAVRQKIEAVRFDWNDYEQAQNPPKLSCPGTPARPLALPSYKTFDCLAKNPCYDGHEEHRNGHFFPTDNECQFVQCSNFGQCFVRQCAPGFGFNPSFKGCTPNDSCARKWSYEDYSD